MSKLDHHVGKRVESVDTEGAAWNITLEGGTKITNHKRSTKPDVEGLVLMVVETLRSGDGATTYRMHFGRPNAQEEIVEVLKGHYEIDGEDPHPEVESDLPPDPSAERIHDEPEGGWEAFQKREKMAVQEKVENAEG